MKYIHHSNVKGISLWPMSLVYHHTTEITIPNGIASMLQKNHEIKNLRTEGDAL